MPVEHNLTVYGRPMPQGSLRAFKTPSGAIVTPQKPDVLKYRADIQAQWGIPRPTSHPCLLEVIFHFRRPMSHYLPANSKRVERELREDAPGYMAQAPDIDKLVRSVMDALTGYAYVDDQQVVAVVAGKHWGEADSTDISLVEVKP